MRIAAAATIVRTFGRSGATIAWLRAFNPPQPVPQRQRPSLGFDGAARQEANEAAGER